MRSKLKAYGRLFPIIFLIIATTLIVIGVSSPRSESVEEITTQEVVEISTESPDEIVNSVIPLTENTKPSTEYIATTQKQTTTTQVATTQKVTTTQSTVQDTPVNQYYTEQDAIDLAKVLWKECGGVNSKTEQACVAWTVLNWVDIDGISVQKEVRKPNRFAFYESTRVDKGMLDLAYDVLNRWSAEKNGETDVGRVLPKDYLYFEGHGGHNHFRNAFKGNYTVWDYSLPSPYDT